jgi:integrase
MRGGRRELTLRDDKSRSDALAFDVARPDDLFNALVATLPPREDRDLEAPLFPQLTDAALRVGITKVCTATGTPHFSPHGLRRRRGSLHYKRTGSLADVVELLGD